MKHWKTALPLFLASLLFASFFGTKQGTYAIYQDAPVYHPASYFGFVKGNGVQIQNNQAKANLESFYQPQGSFTHYMDVSGENVDSFDYYFYAQYGQRGALDDMPTFYLGGSKIHPEVAVVGDCYAAINDDAFGNIAEAEEQFQGNYEFLSSDTPMKHFRYEVHNNSDAFLSFSINVLTTHGLSSSPAAWATDNGIDFSGNFGSKRTIYVSFYSSSDPIVNTWTENADVTITKVEETPILAKDIPEAMGKEEPTTVEPELMRRLLSAKMIGGKVVFNESMFDRRNTNGALFLCKAHVQAPLAKEPKSFVAIRNGMTRVSYVLVAQFASGINYPVLWLSLNGEGTVTLAFNTAPSGVYYDSSLGASKVQTTEEGHHFVQGVSPNILVGQNQSRNVDPTPLINVFDNVWSVLLTLFLPVAYPALLPILIRSGNVFSIVASSIVFVLALGLFCGFVIPAIVRRHKRKKQQK